jgi:hypothetical protein
MKSIVFAIIFMVPAIQASVYNVPKNGPWNIDSVNAVSLHPGDSVLFERGGVYRGAIIMKASGSAGLPITFAAYGVGAPPVISGSVPITGWTSGNGALQQASVTQNIRLLFSDDSPLTLARYPNHGYRTISDSLSETAFRDTGIDASKNWLGATAHLRTMRWTISSKTVVSFNAAQKSLTLNAAPIYGIKSGWGYFLNNIAAALDTSGEWYYDSIAHVVNVIMPDNGSASGHVLEGSMYTYGFDIRNCSYITINGFRIRNQILTGINASGGSHITLRNNTILYADAYGINLAGGATGHVLDSNVVYGSNTGGINAFASSSIFSNNRIDATALLERLGRAGMGDLCCSGRGLQVEGNNNVIRGNSLDSTGYIAIGFYGQNTLIEYNFLNHTCVTKDDGAGIYTWSADYQLPASAGSIIRNNIVINSVGATAGTDNAAYVPANGIYMDDRIHDVQVYDNTAAWCGYWGYQLHNNYNLVFTNNTAFGNNNAQISMNEDFTTATDSMRANRVIGNRFCSTSPLAPCLYATSTHATASMGTFDSNYYCSPYSYSPISYLGEQFSLSTWKAFLGQDAFSKDAFVHWDRFTVTDTLSGDMVKNGTFDAGLTSWSQWPETALMSADSGHGMNGKCLRAKSAWDGSRQPIFNSNNFKVFIGRQYLLTFSACGVHEGQVTMVVRQSGSAYASRGLDNSVGVGTARRDYNLLFTATATDTPCRVDIAPGHSDTLLWIDNVRLHEVNADTGFSSSRLALLLNPTMHDSLVTLSAGHYRDLDGKTVTGSVSLKPFTSLALVADSMATANLITLSSRPVLPSLSAYPNPFKKVITIGVAAGVIDFAAIYDLSGRLVDNMSLVPGKPSKGIVKYLWNAFGRPCGAYCIRVKAGNKTMLKKIFLMK